MKLITRTATDEQFAMKIYEQSHNSTEDLRRNLMSEVKTLQQLNHPHIVKLHDWFEGKWFVYLVLDNLGKTTLLDLIESPNSKTLDEGEAAFVLVRVAKALSYLHERYICHRDVKLDNIMVTPGGDIKLIDFGFSVKFKRDQKLTTFCGTPSYMAPELLARSSHIPAKVDVWAFGVCMYRALVGNFPFKGIFDLFRHKP